MAISDINRTAAAVSPFITQLILAKKDRERSRKIRQEDLERMQKDKDKLMRQQFLSNIYHKLDPTQQRAAMSEFGINFPPGETEVGANLSKEALGLGSTTLSPEESTIAGEELRRKQQQAERMKMLAALGIKGESAAGMLESGYGEELGISGFGRSPVDIATEKFKIAQTGEREAATKTEEMRLQNLQADIDLKKQKKDLERKKGDPKSSTNEKRLYLQNLSNVITKQIDLLDNAKESDEIDYEEYKTQRTELSNELIQIKREIKELTGLRTPPITKKTDVGGTGMAAGQKAVVLRELQQLQKAGQINKQTIGKIYQRGVPMKVIEEILDSLGAVED